MTESEWLGSLNPKEMTDFLANNDMGTGRKYRLFVCACVRRIWPLLSKESYRLAVELSEQAADGIVTDDTIHDAWMEWLDDDHDFGSGGEAMVAALAATGVSYRWDLADAHQYAVMASTDSDAELEAQSRLMRCISGNPFRPITINPVRLSPTVSSLAQSAYDERIMPAGELDPDRLAVLSDALEEAGCADAEILNYLRSTGPHVRGCWVIDLFLGKE